jgi:hypothetical protein
MNVYPGTQAAASASPPTSLLGQVGGARPSRVGRTLFSGFV